jgi:hypothetical protein
MPDRTEYMRAYRRTPAGQAQLLAQKRRSAARDRAYRILASRYEREFGDIFREELLKEINRGT